MSRFSSFIFLLTYLFLTNAFADNLRIQPAELKKALNANVITVIDVRPAKDYLAGHIPGALSFPATQTYAHQQTNGRITSPRKMQHYIQGLGLLPQTQIVIYDQGTLMDAARVFWAFEVYGLQNVKVLNEGLLGWKIAGYNVTKLPSHAQPSQYVVQINNKRLASKLTTQLATLNSNQVIIDARPHNAYLGEVSHADRAGHIPTAINIVASHNIYLKNGHYEIQPIDKLEKLYRKIPKNKKVITYCTIGRTSAANYFALRELGYDVANYDASWKEWADDLSLPIVKPAHALSETVK